MRTTWNGSISFGLVNIPVGLAPATASSARQSDVQFKMLHRECLTPIRQKRWCPVHDIEVGPDQIVRGWEVAKGQFVPIEDAELEAIEQHDTSRSIEITRFVAADEVDPVYFDRTYYLVPAGTEAQRRPYALIRAKGDALALETLFVAEDVKSQAEIDEAVAGTPVRGEELSLARQIVAGLEGPFEPEELRSEYRASLRRLLEAKLEGQELVAPEPVEAEAPPVDLMEALRASVAAAKTVPAKPTPAPKKPAASSARKRAAGRK